MNSEVVNLISTVGFPIFVALWFMLRTEKVIEANTEALIRVSEALNRLDPE